jgi:hypothetical protein
MILARFGIFVLVVLLALRARSSPLRSTVAAAAGLLALVAIPWATMRTPVYAVTASDLVWSPLALRGWLHLRRVLGLESYRVEIAQESRSALEASKLTPSMVRSIGQATVDVYPWETSYVAANFLSWSPRPLAASFNGFTPALDGLNETFFRSRARPEFLIWHSTGGKELLSIDERYLLWDEPRTLRAIVDHYDVVEAGSSCALLRAREEPRFGAPRSLGTQKVAWNAWVGVPEGSGAILLGAALERSIGRRLVRALFREDPVRIAVRFGPGDSRVYRVVPDHLESGLWLDPFPAVLEEMVGLLESGEGKKAKAVRFQAEPLLRKLSPSLTVTWYEMDRRGKEGSRSRTPGDG